METKTKRTASLDAIQQRLEARAKDLDRQMLHALRKAGIDPHEFFSPSPQTDARTGDPKREQLARELAAKLEQGGTSWEELSRPNLEDLDIAPNMRLLRV